MARTATESKLLIKVEAGATASGGTAYRTRSFSNLNPDATDNSVFSAGTKLANMQTHTLSAIQRQDTATLSA